MINAGGAMTSMTLTTQGDYFEMENVPGHAIWLCCGARIGGLPA
jgi:hypothetical protein